MLNSRAKASHSSVGVFTVTVSAAPVVSVQTHISLSAMSLYELTRWKALIPDETLVMLSVSVLGRLRVWIMRTTVWPIPVSCAYTCRTDSPPPKAGGVPRERRLCRFGQQRRQL